MGRTSSEQQQGAQEEHSIPAVLPRSLLVVDTKRHGTAAVNRLLVDHTHQEVDSGLDARLDCNVMVAVPYERAQVVAA